VTDDRLFKCSDINESRYSIAYGLITGIATYVILNGLAWIIFKLSSERVVPHDYDQADYWTPRSRDGILPGWLKRLAKGKRDFWREWNYDEEPEHNESRHDSYGQTVDWHGPGYSESEIPRTMTNDFTRTWEMPRLSPTKSFISGSPIEFLPDARRMERIQISQRM
jgi:AGZA family xanthine/uracil permease-like MFS transporter